MPSLKFYENLSINTFLYSNCHTNHVVVTCADKSHHFNMPRPLRGHGGGVQ